MEAVEDGYETFQDARRTHTVRLQRLVPIRW